MATRTDFAALLALLESERITPVVDRTFPLAEAADAHRRLEDAQQFGKIVLTIPA
jgi:NADPH:quinone reductase-like Zn-dependent oxidoreductase